MIKPRVGELDYTNLDELGFYFMFISSCLSEEDYNKLKATFEEKGGRNYMPWWKFVMENTKVELSIK